MNGICLPSQSWAITPILKHLTSLKAQAAKKLKHNNLGICFVCRNFNLTYDIKARTADKKSCKTSNLTCDHKKQNIMYPEKS